MTSGTKRHSGVASYSADIVPATGDTAAAGPLVTGYARVPTEDQRLDFQRDALAHAGCHRSFEDRASDARTDRSGLAAALSHLCRGDTFGVWRLDRLSRTTYQLVNPLERFERNGIRLRSFQDRTESTLVIGALCCRSLRCSPRWSATSSGLQLSNPVQGLGQFLFPLSQTHFKLDKLPAPDARSAIVLRRVGGQGCDESRHVHRWP